MNNRIRYLAITLGLTAAVLAPGATARSAPAHQVARAVSPIKHIVVILKENRSFDEYFGQFPAADGTTTATKHDGTTVTLAQSPDPLPNDINHDPAQWHLAYDNGKMDGFDLEQGAYSSTGQPLALSQMTESQIPDYWAYARRYSLADKFFAAWQGASFANNMLGLAAQAGQYDSTLGNRTIYGNPKVTDTTPYWGCDDPTGTVVQMIDPISRLQSNTFPCFNFSALPNALAAAGVSWHFYNTTGVQSKHDPLDALKPVRNDPSLWSRVVPTSQFTTDATNGTLPAVSWLVGRWEDHPPQSACNGENETSSYINSVMNGPDWASTAILIYWDEWGGFYDHVAPPIVGDGVSYGFRVPFLLISPYSRAGASSDGGSITSTMYSPLSVLKFIENNWSIPALTPKDASANDLTGMLDFTAPPKAPLILAPRTCPALSATTAAAALAAGD